MNAVEEVVRSVLALLTEGNYDALASLTGGHGLSADQMATAVHTYGRTIVFPPDFVFADMDVVEVQGQPSRTLHVRFPLWTAEEGRSDVELEMTLREVVDGIYSIRIDNIHVP